jgi:hypothetical protein
MECVGHDAEGNEIWQEVPPVAAPTTVSVYVNGELVLRTTNGDGKELWSVGTIVLHADDQVGGYAVDEGRLDITQQGEVNGFVLGNASAMYCSVSHLSGPNGSGTVFLSAGEAVQFSAEGTIFQQYFGNNQSVTVIDCFTSSDETVGSVDALGVFVAKAPGHTQISSRNYSGAPIDVYVLQGVKMAMDGNRDGEIDFDDPDDKSYLFWVNDDCDISHENEGMWQEDDYGPAQTSHQDWDDDNIGNKGSPGEGACMRDLEDFTRLHIKVDPVVSNMDGVTYWLRFENVTEGNPYVNVFKAVRTTDEYLSKTAVAEEQIQEDNLTPENVCLGDVQIAAECITKNGEVSPFLLEGCFPGSGDLTFIVKSEGREICKTAVRLTLKRMTYFYDLRSTDVSAPDIDWTVVVSGFPQFSNVASYQPKTDERFLLVHGWNMDGGEKREWAATAFKRLWWQGYQGSVALFDWPTLYGCNFYNVVTRQTDLRNFDNSEFRAWLSSVALAGLLDELNANGKLRVMAHSMGNIVMGEALRKYKATAPPLHTYIACQAAISAHYYDNTVAAAYPCNYQNLDLTFPANPDIIGHFIDGENMSPYMCFNRYRVTNMQNWYNPVDWALDLWEKNNIAKPDNWGGFGFGYSGRKDHYDEGTDRFFGGPCVDAGTCLSVNDDRQRYMIFAYDMESRSRALGQTESSVFSGWNLKNPLSSGGMGYDDQHYCHSREFRSNIAAEWEFWKKVFGTCKFQRPQ